MFGVPYHFLVVHFPIALIVAAVVCDLRGEHEAGYRITVWSAVLAAVGVLTGLMLGGGRMSQMPVHAGAGIGGGFLAIVVAMLRYSSRARDSEPRPYPALWLALAILAALSILVAGFTGHRAVLGY
jgi:uncharacterized membrane protein